LANDEGNKKTRRSEEEKGAQGRARVALKFAGSTTTKTMPRKVERKRKSEAGGRERVQASGIWGFELERISYDETGRGGGGGGSGALGDDDGRWCRQAWG